MGLSPVSLLPHLPHHHHTQEPTNSRMKTLKQSPLLALPWTCFVHNPHVAIEPWQLQTVTIQWLPHSTAFSKLVPGEAYDKRQSGKRLPDQLRHRSHLLFLLIWRHLQPMMTMLQSANELQHWRKTKTTTPSKRSFCCHWLLHSIYWKKNPCQVRQKKRDCKINVTVIFPTKRSWLVPMSDASPTARISDCVPTSWRFLALIPWASTLPMGAANISERATWKSYISEVVE